MSRNSPRIQSYSGCCLRNGPARKSDPWWPAWAQSSMVLAMLESMTLDCTVPPGKYGLQSHSGTPAAEGRYEIMKTTAMSRLIKSVRVILVGFPHSARQAASSRAAFTLFRPSRRGNRAAFGNQKAKGKSGKWVLNAFRLQRGGHLLPFTFYVLPFTFPLFPGTREWVAPSGPLSPRAGASGNETRVPSVRNPKSRIQNHVSALRRS